MTRAGHVIAIDSLLNATSGQADLVLPSTPFAESTGTFVNNEGRAQRFFRVFSSGGETRESWRWLRELLTWLDRPEAKAWTVFNDVIESLERELPQMRGVSDAAPSSAWRAQGRKVARQPARWSGRTALDAAESVREPAPLDDPDSALAFSLEGIAAAAAPRTLAPRDWSPGWNSASGLPAQRPETDGRHQDGPFGVRLALTTDEPRAWPAVAVPAQASPRTDQWQLVAVHHLFGSDDLSMYSPGVAQRAPGLYLAINDADAARLEVGEGDWLLAWLPWMDIRAPFRRMASLPDGIAGLPVGLPRAPYVALPASARLLRHDGARTGWQWRPRRRPTSDGAEA